MLKFNLSDINGRSTLFFNTRIAHHKLNRKNSDGSPMWSSHYGIDNIKYVNNGNDNIKQITDLVYCSTISDFRKQFRTGINYDHDMRRALDKFKKSDDDFKLMLETGGRFAYSVNETYSQQMVFVCTSVELRDREVQIGKIKEQRQIACDLYGHVFIIHTDIDRDTGKRTNTFMKETLDMTNVLMNVKNKQGNTYFKHDLDMYKVERRGGDRITKLDKNATNEQHIEKTNEVIDHVEHLTDANNAVIDAVIDHNDKIEAMQQQIAAMQRLLAAHGLVLESDMKAEIANFEYSGDACEIFT